MQEGSLNLMQMAEISATLCDYHYKPIEKDYSMYQSLHRPLLMV